MEFDADHFNDLGNIEVGDLQDNAFDIGANFDDELDHFGLDNDQDPDFLKRQQEEYEKYQQLFKSQKDLNA